VIVRLADGGRGYEPLRVRILWCRRYVGPWYFSGGEFV
jgi:hypothetical protein